MERGSPSLCDGDGDGDGVTTVKLRHSPIGHMQDLQ